MSRVMVMVCAGALLFWGVAPGAARGLADLETADIQAVEFEPIDWETATSNGGGPDCGECAGSNGEPCCCQCPIRPIAHGEISGFHLGERGFRGLRGIIKDPDSWAVFWDRHTHHLDPAPPPPPVDFEESAVVVALLGKRTSGGGPNIKIVRANRCEDWTMVHLGVNNHPGPLDIITNPFDIVAIPRTCLARSGSIGFMSHAPRRVPGMVVGRVLGADPSGAQPVPLDGARVRLVKGGEDPIVVAQAETNEEGMYKLPDIRPGHYRAIATYPGYLPLDKPIVLGSGKTLAVDFVLREGADPPPGDDD
ncbi:MAG: carboxypeptidase regulatory-like domain-containing protein [bacterium]|nr:carboxypeptidase regulatory-like domain-containing protein [bacterium]